jgi:hypothetical protein
LAQAFTSLMIVIGLRPVFYALWIISPLRFIGPIPFSLVGLAAGVPIAALFGITIYLLDTDTTFHALAGEDEERVAGRIEPPPPVGIAPASAVPARARVAASSRSPNGANDPPFDANEVGAAAPAAASNAAPSLAASNPKSLPRWFAAYSSVSEAAPTSSAALEVPPPAPPAESPPAHQELAAANSMAALPDDQASAPASPITLLPPLRVPSAKVAALIEIGKKAATAGDLEKAVRNFSEAVRIDPSYPGGYSERGQALFELGETDRAIADYSAA